MFTDVKQSQLLEFVKELKEAGFKVYAPSNVTTYCHFVKDDKIGYVERGDYGFNFCTVHKPCLQCGTGFSMARETYNPTIQMAEDSLAVAPNWATNTDRKAVRKYKNWEEFAKLESYWTSYTEL